MISSSLFFPLSVHSRKKSNSRRAADSSLRSPYAAVRHKPSEQTETGQQETSRYHSLGQGGPLFDLQHSCYCPQSLSSSSLIGGTYGAPSILSFGQFLREFFSPLFSVCLRAVQGTSPFLKVDSQTLDS